MKTGMGGAMSVIESLGGWQRPFRAQDVSNNGVDRAWLEHLAYRSVTKLDHGVYGALGADYPRIAIATLRVRNSIACLSSALWLHRLIPQEPLASWVCIRHKAWAPTGELRTPIRLIRTKLWPLDQDLTQAGQELPVTTVARTVLDFFRYPRLIPADAAEQALELALAAGKCTLEDIDACAARYRVRWRCS
jgi:predicted transcriptional regulator of viral defense system